MKFDRTPSVLQNIDDTWANRIGLRLDPASLRLAGALATR